LLVSVLILVKTSSTEEAPKSIPMDSFNIELTIYTAAILFCLDKIGVEAEAAVLAIAAPAAAELTEEFELDEVGGGTIIAVRIYSTRT